MDICSFFECISLLNFRLVSFAQVSSSAEVALLDEKVGDLIGVARMGKVGGGGIGILGHCYESFPSLFFLLLFLTNEGRGGTNHLPCSSPPRYAAGDP